MSIIKGLLPQLKISISNLQQTEPESLEDLITFFKSFQL